MEKFNLEQCKKTAILAKTKYKLVDKPLDNSFLAYIIPYKMAYTNGCMKKLKLIVIPVLTILFTLILSSNLATIVVDFWIMHKIAKEQETEKIWKHSMDFIKKSTGKNFNT